MFISAYFLIRLHLVETRLSWRRVLPEHNDLLCCILPPLVLLQADVAAVLLWVEPPSDCCTQMSQGPVEVMVQQTGGCF